MRHVNAYHPQRQGLTRNSAAPVGSATPGPGRRELLDTTGSATVLERNVRRYLVMPDFEYVSYETFGRRFFEVAVTEQRVGAAFAAIAGSQFDMPPMAQGPGGIAKVSAKVTIKQPQVTRNVEDSITFAIHIPLLIDLLLDLRIDKQRFTVDGDIGLTATARAAEPLLLIVDVAKPRSSDIMVHVSSKSIRGELLRVIAGVDGEIRRFIAQYVREEIEKPESQAAQVIDVAQQLDQTWKGI
jgi:hypothetical protein